MSRPAGGGYALPERKPGRRDGLRARAERIPGLLPAYRASRRAGMELRMLTRGWASARRVRGDADGAERFRRQAVRTLAPDGGLRAALDAHGIPGRDLGAGAFHVPAHPSLGAALGAGWALYPPGAALVALPGIVTDEARLERVLAGNLLHSEGLGPRVYDATRFEDGLTGFAIQADDADVAVPPGAEPAARLARLVADGTLTADAAATDPSAPGFARFRAPAGDALVRRALEGETAGTLHFGRERWLGPRRYLYQSIPATGDAGRRDSARRWRQITGMLEKSGAGVEDRVVLDVGCNAGMMLAAALADGAAWGVGWDLPDVCETARRLQGSLGFTRLDLVGAEMGPGYSLRPAIPAHLEDRLDGSILLYLAIRHHVGFVADLGAIPWRALVYEGGETESVARLEEALAPLRAQTSFRVAAAVDFRDGEGLSRPLAVLVRPE